MMASMYSKGKNPKPKPEMLGTGAAAGAAKKVVKRKKTQQDRLRSVMHGLRSSRKMVNQ